MDQAKQIAELQTTLRDLIDGVTTLGTSIVQDVPVLLADELAAGKAALRTAAE